MDQEKMREIEAREHMHRRERKHEHACAHCGAALRTPREQSARLCSWCEEGLNSTD